MPNLSVKENLKYIIFEFQIVFLDMYLCVDKYIGLCVLTDLSLYHRKELI